MELNLVYSRPSAFPAEAVGQVLEDIKNNPTGQSKDEPLPVTGVFKATARLSRMGINFVAILKVEEFGREYVPIRVQSDLMETPYYQDPVASWKGRQVQHISLGISETFDKIKDKVLKCLRQAYNRVLRRIQKNAHKAKLRLERTTRKLRRAVEREKYRRFESCRMAH